MPSSVSYDTVTCFSLAPMLTTNDAVAPSITAVASPIDSTAGSSLSVIVPVAVVPSVASVAFTGLLSFTVNVYRVSTSGAPSASSTVSFAVTTVTVFVVAPASNVSVPLVDV